MWESDSAVRPGQMINTHNIARAFDVERAVVRPTGPPEFYAAAMSGIDWGDVPTWLGAFFAAGAAGAAVWTLASQRSQIREQRQFIGEQAANLLLERAELRAALAERRAAQASQVTYELGANRRRGPLNEATGHYEQGEREWHAEVTNHSSEPVHDVTVSASATDLPHAHRLIRSQGGGMRGPMPSHLGEDIGAPVSIIGAQVGYVFKSDPFGDDVAGLDNPVLFFTDNNGVRWRLDAHGDLREQASADPS